MIAAAHADAEFHRLSGVHFDGLLASVGVHNVVQGVEADDQADPIESLEKRRGFVYSVDSGMWLS